jgi:predicted lipid carrier protein YhbT
VIVEVDDDVPNGLATMLAALIEANLERHPARRALLRDGVFHLSAVDAAVSATISTAGGGVRVSNGAGRAHVSVRASSSDLLLLASAPLRAGFPDPLSREGRAVVRGVAGGRIRIRGWLSHPLRLSRLARLLFVG